MKVLYIFNITPIMESLAHTNQIVKTFCVLDDLSVLICGKTHRGRQNSLSRSEIATIILMKTIFGINCLKKLYCLLQTKYQYEFHLPSYKNFVVTMNKYSLDFLLIVNILLQIRHTQSGIVKIIDSTSISVCRNIRIVSEKRSGRFEKTSLI